MEDFKSVRGVDVQEFKEKVHRELIVDVTQSKVYRARRIAKALIEGRYKEQYKLLWRYCEELKRSNPGSSVHMHVKEDYVSGNSILAGCMYV